MRARLASLALSLIAVSPVSAQDKPPAAVTAAVAGTWQLDLSRSDSIPANPMALLGGGGASGPGGAAAAVGGAPTGVGASGRSGGRRGGGGGGSGASGSGAQGLDPRRGSGGLFNDPKIRRILIEGYPARVMLITATDFDVTIADTLDHLVPWRADGTKKLEAQMEGGVIEQEAKWKGKTLVVERGVPGVASLRREFKPIDAGRSLEVKTVIATSSRKVEKTFVYTRVETVPKP